MEVKQGGFSDGVWNSIHLRKYLKFAGVFGWIGNSARTNERDKILENELRKTGLENEGIANWSTSIISRHFADSVENCTDSEFEKQVLIDAKYAFLHVTIWNHPDFEGTLDSRIQLTNKLIESIKNYQQSK